VQFSSERVFSTAGCNLEKRRNCLSDKSVDTLLFYIQNITVKNFDRISLMYAVMNCSVLNKQLKSLYLCSVTSVANNNMERNSIL